ITPTAAFAAIAASTALPPFANMVALACEASVCSVAAIPYLLIVIENALSREGSRGFLRESRMNPPAALGVGDPAPGELDCASAIGNNARASATVETALKQRSRRS